MIISGNDPMGIHSLKQFLHQQFEMKDLGHFRYFLGIEVAYSQTGYLLSQTKYCNDVIQRAGLTDQKLVSTPMEHNAKLRTSDGVPLNNATRYREIVGSLLYLKITRPDIAHYVHVVSQFMDHPTSVHWAIVIRILRYLQGTSNRALLTSSNSSLDLNGFTDSNWASDVNDQRSTTVFAIFLGSSFISWKSKKQEVVSRSSSESEYRAIGHTTTKIIWLRWLLQDLGVPITVPTPLYTDSESARKLAFNEVFHERTKHVEVECNFIHQHIRDDTIQLSCIPSTDQIADFFTKSQSAPRFTQLVSKLSMLTFSHPELEGV